MMSEYSTANTFVSDAYMMEFSEDTHSAHEFYGMDAMMQFRTTYLRAIARSWKDHVFLQNLLLDPIGTLQENLEYVFPWDVSLKIHHPSPEDCFFDPVNTGGWVGKNAIITIWIPPHPEYVEDHAEAWAAYYHEFPSFLGSRIRIPQISKSDKSKPHHITGPYPLGMGKWSNFLEFSAVIMRLIAMAWRVKRIQHELQDQHHSGINILNKWLGYCMPWNMDVKFSLSGWDGHTSSESEMQCRWNSNKKVWPRPLKDNVRPDTCRNGLTFYIPRRPDDANHDSSIEAIALSAYNVTGNAYPLTCP